MNLPATTTPNADNLAALLAGAHTLAPQTRRTYAAALAAFLRWLAGRPVTRLTVERYAAELLAQGKATSTVNKSLAAVRWYARRVAVLVAEDAGRPVEERRELEAAALAAAQVEDVKGTRPQAGRHIDGGELSALLAACAADKSAAGARDAALLAVGAGCGLRVGEVAGLTLSAVTWESEREARLTLQHAKGGKVRVVYLTNGTAAAVRDWLAVRGPGAPDAPLFLPVRGGRVVAGPVLRGRRGQSEAVLTPPRLSTQAVEAVLARRAAEAGLEQHTTWHDFRRTFAGTLLDSGADLVTVQQLLGHSSPVTTAAYDRRGEETKRRALRALHVPYRARR